MSDAMVAATPVVVRTMVVVGQEQWRFRATIRSPYGLPSGLMSSLPLWACGHTLFTGLVVVRIRNLDDVLWWDDRGFAPRHGGLTRATAGRWCAYVGWPSDWIVDH